MMAGMARQKQMTAEDYIQWLIASPKDATMTEASRCSPKAASHDSYRRLLLDSRPSSTALWEEVEGEVSRETGLLVLDDSTLDKPYGPKIELVTQHWSGKHRRVVQGINLTTLLWTDGEVAIPIDYRIYDKARDGKTKNDHLADMLEQAHKRGFQPEMVIFDSWYGSMANLKLVRRLGWHFLCGLKKNRHVSPVKGVTVEVQKIMSDESGTKVHLKGVGFIRTFQTVLPEEDGEPKYWATSLLTMDRAQFDNLRVLGTWIEQYHRSIKQHCLVERCQARKAVIQRNHIGFAIRAFVRMELHRFDLGISIFEIKRRMLREAICAYRRTPFYTLDGSVHPRSDRRVS